MPSGDVQKSSPLLLRPISSNGLPVNLSGVININEDTSLAAKEYYVEALPGERLLIGRFIVHIFANGNIASGEYGNGAALTNGIKIIYRREGILFNVTNGLPIKINEDWGRYAFDAQPVVIGATTQYFQSRLTLTKFGSPWGVILNEGDRLGVRTNDNLSVGVSEQTIFAEGVHLGVQDERWFDILDPLP